MFHSLEYIYQLNFQIYFILYTTIYYILNVQNIIDSDFVHAQTPLNDIHSISLVIQPPLSM